MNQQQSPNTPISEQLTGTIKPIKQLTPDEIEAMCTLFQSYFLQVQRQAFEADLREKDWAIVLRDSQTAELAGFSTLLVWQTMVDQQPIQAFFSGDTLIAKPYWGTTVLPRLWSRFVFHQAAQSAAPSYWFLICSGYKTYRFLPVFFQEFYPTYRATTPLPMQQLLDQLGLARYGSGYDSATGIIMLPNATPLKAEVAAITEQRRTNQDIVFFEARNPGHLHGDELACLVPIHPDNLTRAGQRMVFG